MSLRVLSPDGSHNEFLLAEPEHFSNRKIINEWLDQLHPETVRNIFSFVVINDLLSLHVYFEYFKFLNR